MGVGRRGLGEGNVQECGCDGVIFVDLMLGAGIDGEERIEECCSRARIGGDLSDSRDLQPEYRAWISVEI